MNKSHSKAQSVFDDLLDFSPFNFYNGINPKRLLKGISSVNKSHLLRYLTCKFCNNIAV